MPSETSDDAPDFLLTTPVQQGAIRAAQIVLAISVVIFVAAAPFAKTPLPPSWAFIPTYETILVINDLMTAVLLIGQLLISRSRALLVLVSGYLFSALMAAAHMMTYPAVFTPTGLLGAGPQSAAWIWVFWHIGFPLFIIAYSTMKAMTVDRAAPGVPLPILRSIAAVTGLAAALVALATAGMSLLPPVMIGTQYAPLLIEMAMLVWLVTLIAIAALWRRRPLSIIDLWLIMVMCIWLFDVALSTLFNAGRFDLGYYVGRIYAVLSASFVLVMLIEESARLYLRLFSAHESERRRAAELSEARTEAEQANRAKANFLAAMSHEIRTPMNAILGMTDLALRTDLTLKQQGYLARSKEAAQSLLRIIDDILDFSKIEAGKMDLERRPFSLDEVFATLTSVVAHKSRQKGIELLIRPAQDLPERLLGDPLRLDQILINLVNNAVKFSAQGEIVIAVSRVPWDHPTRIKLRFSVRDNGIGMTGTQMALLFRPFSQVDASTTRRFGGTGLGLAICRQLTELMEGEIGVSSVPGKGSEFHFTACFGIDDSAPRPDGRTLAPLRGLRALVVDDSETARDIVIEQLTTLGLAARQVSSARDALIELRRADLTMPFDVMLLDWHLPAVGDCDSVGLVEDIATLIRPLKIILVTAFGPEELQDGIARPDIVGVLTKPVLLSALRDMLVGIATGSPLPPERRQSPDPSEELDIAMIRGKRILVAEDNAINQMLAEELFGAIAGASLKFAATGQEALDALAQESFDLVLMDIEMPVMDGYEATRRIRGDQALYGGMPIIAMTAHAMAKDRHACLAAGMNDFVTKPLDAADVFAVLAQWLAPIQITVTPRQSIQT